MRVGCFLLRGEGGLVGRFLQRPWCLSVVGRILAWDLLWQKEVTGEGQIGLIFLLLLGQVLLGGWSCQSFLIR